jgi:hypothetical protein
MGLGRALAGVVGQQPDLAVALIFGERACTQIVGPILNQQFGRRAFARAPQRDGAVPELVAYTGADLDPDLERHPLVGDVAKAVAVGWEVASGTL